MAGKGKQVGNIVKFFVTNLPEGCTPWELRRSLEGLGDIAGTYVARKRDKQGSRFGFVSFSGVRDCQELLKMLGGVRMGNFKLKFNVARFAMENLGSSVEKESKIQNSGLAGQYNIGVNFKVRDGRSYKDVVVTSSFGNGPVRQEIGQRVEEKTIVVPDRSGAFKDLFGLALVGRTKNLETLVDFDKFTFSAADGSKQSKLDRFLVNSGFFNAWPEADVEAVSSFLSDHCAIILKTELANFGPKPFRIFDSWFDKPGFSEVVNSALNKDPGISGPSDVRLMRKLGILRSELKNWRDEMLNKNSGVVSAALSDLESIQDFLAERNLSEEEEWILIESKKVLKEEEERKSRDMRQRSRIKWAKEGDENTSFFHAMVNCRKASNSIHGLEVNGLWVSKPTLVKKEIYRFFKKKFEEDWVDRPRLVCADIKRISEVDADFLDARFSKEEIKRAIFDCGDDRAPGPDDISFRLIKRFWNLFEVDFFNIMEEFFVNGVINLGCGSSFIALIPKVIDPLSLKEYRPISLVGVVNKVISKILANRLKIVLDSVISGSQSAFIKGRLILDGPLIVNEILNWSRKGKKKVFFLKVDFEKAYDNINWNFVLDILEQMGFSRRWCSWIKGVLLSARASVLVNGSPTFEFGCHKGMRQGDPISPFLFVIVMEALSCMFNKASSLGIVKGVSLPNEGPTITHLFYADDAIIMGEWSKDNIRNVVRILKCFHVCSGLRINLGKSNLIGVGVQPEEVDEMAIVVGYCTGSFPFKFLGLCVGSNMNRTSSWQPVVDAFEKRLSLWKASMLSVGGDSGLALIRKFLWGGNSEIKKIHWVAWDRVASPVDMGGLGLQHLKDVNTALLAKWGWRYKNEQDSLWVKVVNAIHFGYSEWDFLPLRKAVGGVWSSVVSVLRRPLFENVPFRSLFKGVVGNGEKIMFWLDPWLFDVPLKDKYPALFALEVVKPCSIKDRLDEDGLWLWRHEPDSPEETADWQSLRAAVASVCLSSGPDKWVWLGSGASGFSVAAVKSLLVSSRDFSNRFVMEWCNWVPKKCNIFAWRAELNRIPTVEALEKRGMVVIDDGCNFCNENLDSVSHIFTACRLALGVWEKISFWCKIPKFFVFSFRDLVEIHKVGDRSLAERKALHGIVISTCWVLWKARNNLRFNGISSSVDEVFSEVMIVSFFWFKYRAKKRQF
ncbi:putative RNA-directed DNA polymerase [Helianthus annuus]|nr:putative RNA-directed DNA polymerase [Helianthus annuus]